MTVDPDELDPITFSVVRNGLKKTCDEMDIAFANTAFSPVISEGRDRASGIYDLNGDMISQGDYALPIFIGIMHYTVHDTVEHIDDFQPGDVVIVNDPYHGGTHVMDVRMVRPFYYDDELFCFLANTGHWADFGGMVPGGFSPDATEIFQEGLRLPPLKIVEEGELNEDVVDIMMKNIRIADQQRGDLQAQISTLETGEQRLRELVDKHGKDVVRACMDRSKDVSAEKMREIISDVPDGRYHAEDYMDSDGIVDEPLTVDLDMIVEGDELTVDFTGSSLPCEGPVNSVPSTSRSAVFIALKHMFPEIPMSSGIFEPVEIELPDESFLNAKEPKPVAGCAAETSQRIVDACMSAISDASPDRASGNPFGTIMNYSMGGDDPEREEVEDYVMYQFCGGGYGGFKGSDGLTHGAPSISISNAQPIEILENKYPIRYERWGINEESEGPGRWRGGFGSEHRITLQCGSASASVLGDRARFGPKGYAGGDEAETAHVQFRIDGEAFVPEHGSKVAGVRLSDGDEIVLQIPGGGGYGDPFERPPEQVRSDVEMDLIGRERARERYGVVITEDGAVDEAETHRLRKD